MKSLTKLIRYRFSSYTPATLPKLDFEYGELEPVLSANLLSFHHGKHHQTYVNNLNAIYKQIEDATAQGDAKKVASLQPALRFNLGGHLNHSIYWKNLAPKGKGGGVLPQASSPLSQAIQQQYGGYESFMQEFNKRAAAIQGSGWGWLAYDTVNKNLRLFELANQEIPDFSDCIPLLTIDMWEHAFYLDYQNVKVKYLSDIWQIVNWADVEARYLDAIKQN
uniref:Superoxide dismutase n=1 Tax=Philasterides dicentrarchi TaxID=282688 RepID=A0A410JA19_9CILI|nr:superoxide dismutase [Fe] protein [Philasterides dicentrarchi]QBK46546.1 manganese superoxide dismutase [Philasterides dicentrarchi]QKV26157.1 manganese superoxide dismutase [Philasterides dicentrarchi]